MYIQPGLYESDQRKRLLSIILWSILIVTALFGALNIQYRTWASVITLFGLSALCVPALALNARGYLFTTASFISLIILMTINVNLIDGDGIHDFGLLAYPIFITIGALFFGRRAIPFFALGSAVSVAVIAKLEDFGYIHPTLGPAKGSDVVTILILFGLASIIVWVILRTLENNFKRIRESETELLNTYELTLEAWAKVMELRDHDTEGHSRRLVELSTRLARKLKCSEDEIAHLRRGALLHDIGKLAVPDSVLLKPDVLDSSDRKIIEKHPGFARDLLINIPFLHPSIDVVYSHHERWDGKGYPQGLKGMEIPLLARIFTVVDNWDALGSDRVYRRAWPHEKIVAYLQENSGTIFDPHIVEVFLKSVLGPQTVAGES